MLFVALGGKSLSAFSSSQFPSILLPVKTYVTINDLGSKSKPVFLEVNPILFNEPDSHREGSLVFRVYNSFVPSMF